MKKYLINGGSGFVAKSLVKYLAQKGCYGIVCSRKSHLELPNGWKHVVRPNDFRKLQLDTAENDYILIHTEVCHHINSRNNNTIALFNKVNVDGFNSWLTWCDNNNVNKVIYLSSIKAVKNISTNLDENTPGPGNTLYGESKWKAEKLFDKWLSGKSSKSGLILRPAVIYGPGNTANMYKMINAIYHRRFFLIGSNKNVKSMVALDNVVSSVYFLSKRMKEGCHIYNVTDKSSYSIAQIANMIQQQLYPNSEIKSLPLKFVKVLSVVGDVIHFIFGKTFISSQQMSALTENSWFNCTKLTNEGYIHSQSTEDGIKKTVQWFLDRLR